MIVEKTYLEEEPDNKDLQSAHGHHKEDLDHAEVDDALLCAADRAEVSVLARPEVFLVTGDGGQLARDLPDRLLKSRRLLRRRSLLRGQADTRLVLDLQFDGCQYGRQGG